MHPQTKLKPGMRITHSTANEAGFVINVDLTSNRAYIIYQGDLSPKWVNITDLLPYIIKVE